MKKLFTVFFLLVVLVLQTIAVSALTASEAKQEWRDLKQVSKDKKQIHRDAKIEYAAEKTEENKQNIIETGKDVLNSALDEAEAWLNWKDLEAEENSEIPADIKDLIKEDVEKNLEKVDGLRSDVDGIENQLELGLVFLKMVGKYFELIADVARNTGKMWVHIANEKIGTIEDYESKLREETDDENIIAKLDAAKEDIEEAQSNVDKAESSYEEVVTPGTPLIKFAEGNNYLRTARTNLLSAHRNLDQAYKMMLRGE